MTDTETLTRVVLTTDGRVLVEQRDGSYPAAAGETDWSRVDRMSAAELAAVIAADPDDPGPGFLGSSPPDLPEEGARHAPARC